MNSFPNFKNQSLALSLRVAGKSFIFIVSGGDILKVIYFTNLGKLIYMSIGIFGRLTMEDRKHTHNMGVYSKICPSSKGCVNSSDRSLEDGPSIVTKAFHNSSLIVPGHFYWFGWIKT